MAKSKEAAVVSIGQKDGANPKAKVDSLVSNGQEYPFYVELATTYKRGIVVPSSKFDGVITKDAPVSVAIHTYEQLWGIVMEAAGAAETLKLDEIATLTAKVPVEAPKESE